MTRLGRSGSFFSSFKERANVNHNGKEAWSGSYDQAKQKDRRTEGRMEEGEKGWRSRQEGQSDKRRAGTKDRKMGTQTQRYMIPST